MAEQSLKDKTAKGLFWGGVSNGLQQVMIFVFGVVLARALDVADYGMVGMLAIFSGIASNIQESGFTNALINKKEFDHEDYNAVFWFSTLSGILLYSLLFFLSPLIARFYNNPELINLSRVIFLGFLFGGVTVSQNAFLLKKLMVKERAKIDIVALLVSGITGIVLALLGFSYWALGIQSVVYVGIGSCLRYLYTPWSPTLTINFRPLKDMINFSGKIFVTNVFNQINTHLFSVVIGRLYNPVQVGFYAQGQKWMGIGSSFLGGMIANVAQPVLAEVVDDCERQKHVFRKMIRFGAFLSFPLMFGLAFVSKEFIQIAIGEKWLPSAVYLSFFCVWGAFIYLWVLLGNLLMAHGRSNIYMWGMISTGCLQLVLIILVHSYGIYAMLICYILVYFFVLFCWLIYAKKIIHITLFEVFKDCIPYLGITILTLSFVWLLTSNLENLYFLFCSKIILSILIYIFLMWKTNSVIFNECLSYLLRKR